LISSRFQAPVQTATLFREKAHMKRIFLAAIIATFAAGSAFAQDSCDTQAVGKDGKPLAGAAKTSFMKKCMADACAAKAVGSDGKKLAGAAKTSFMKKCESGG
jgi:opacity protein-like surface antigen